MNFKETFPNSYGSSHYLNREKVSLVGHINEMLKEKHHEKSYKREEISLQPLRLPQNQFKLMDANSNVNGSFVTPKYFEFSPYIRSSSASKHEPKMMYRRKKSGKVSNYYNRRE